MAKLINSKLNQHSRFYIFSTNTVNKYSIWVIAFVCLFLCTLHLVSQMAKGFPAKGVKGRIVFNVAHLVHIKLFMQLDRAFKVH